MLILEYEYIQAVSAAVVAKADIKARADKEKAEAGVAVSQNEMKELASDRTDNFLLWTFFRKLFMRHDR